MGVITGELRRGARRHRPRGRIRRAARLGRHGAASVEFLLWLPIFFAIIGLIVDASLALHAITRMYDAARLAARIVAAGAEDASAGAARMNAVLPDYPGLALEVREDGPFIIAHARAPVDSVTVFAGRFIDLGALDAEVVMLREDAVEEFAAAASSASSGGSSGGAAGGSSSGAGAGRPGGRNEDDEPGRYDRDVDHDEDEDDRDDEDEDWQDDEDDDDRPRGRGRDDEDEDEDDEKDRDDDDEDWEEDDDDRPRGRGRGRGSDDDDDDRNEDEDEDRCPRGMSNPGNDRCVGRAGESPNGRGGWGGGARGRGDR